MSWIARSKKQLTFYGLCLSMAFLIFCSLSAYSQSRPPQSLPSGAAGQRAILVKTEVVVLPVSVTDANGNFISGLGLRNFRVYGDGRPQNITSFHEGDTPVTVGLIVDHSRSMGSKLQEVAAAVSAFAQSSNPQDQMFVVDFNDDVSVELMDGRAFTNDPEELAKAVLSVRARGRTALYDAVAEGFFHLQLGHWDKKALVIVSDGGDNASRQKLSQILALARRSQAAIYSIGLVDANDNDDDENPDALRRLSKDTGGVAFFPASLAGVTAVSKQIARDLRDQYTLGFVPEQTDSDSFHKIRVKVDAPRHGKIHVRSRSGYVSAQEKPSPTPSEKSGS